MIRRLGTALTAATLMSGCLAETPRQDPSLLRNPTVPLSVISRGDAEAMAGTWTVRAASPEYAGVQELRFNTEARPNHLIDYDTMTCDDAGQCEMQTDGWLADPIAQNRWRLTSETAQDEMELWVIWIDDGFRTAALGSPDSDLAFILDRKASGGADRITAATEVMEFNGYNTSAFVTH